MSKLKEYLNDFFTPNGIFVTNFKKSPPIRYIIFGLLLALIPLLQELDLIAYYSVSIFAKILVFTIVALGLNLLLGFSGLISLGTAGFVGFGAYGVAFFVNIYGFPYEISALLTLIIAGLIGAFIGLFSLKVDGIYLAIATLFVGEIFRQIFTQVTWFSGGYSGAKFKYPTLLGFIGLDRNKTFIFMVIILILLMIAIYNIVNSRTGRALMAMSRSEHAAQAMGISLLKYRLIAFITSTIFAAIGGILYVSYFKYVEPTEWNLNLSLVIIAMVVVGGFKSIFGIFLGAFIIRGVPDFWLKEFFKSSSGFSYIFSGVLIIIVIMFYSNGFVYIGYDLKKLYYKIKLKIKSKEVKTNER